MSVVNAFSCYSLMSYHLCDVKSCRPSVSDSILIEMCTYVIFSTEKTISSRTQQQTSKLVLIIPVNELTTRVINVMVMMTVTKRTVSVRTLGAYGRVQG